MAETDSCIVQNSRRHTNLNRCEMEVRRKVILMDEFGYLLDMFGYLLVVFGNSSAI